VVKADSNWDKMSNRREKLKKNNTMPVREQRREEGRENLRRKRVIDVCSGKIRIPETKKSSIWPKGGETETRRSSWGTKREAETLIHLERKFGKPIGTRTASKKKLEELTPQQGKRNSQDRHYPT